MHIEIVCNGNSKNKLFLFLKFWHCNFLGRWETLYHETYLPSLIVSPKSLYFNSYHANCKHKLSSTTKVTKYMHSAKMKRIIRHCDYTLIKL